jgi:hypothetical protein
MLKRLKIVLPASQVLLAVIAYGLPKMVTSLELNVPVLFLRDLVTKINFPIVIVVFPLLYFVDLASKHLPSVTGPYLIIVILVVGVFFC